MIPTTRLPTWRLLSLAALLLAVAGAREATAEADEQEPRELTVTDDPIEKGWICHKTGWWKNPYDKMYVPKSSWHFRSHGGDVVPVLGEVVPLDGTNCWVDDECIKCCGDATYPTCKGNGFNDFLTNIAV